MFAVKIIMNTNFRHVILYFVNYVNEIAILIKLYKTSTDLEHKK